MLTKLEPEATREEVNKEIVKKAKKVKKLHKDSKRSLSPHVVSRWFRAPELILMQKKYDQAVDIWSVGCIFYELLASSTLEPTPGRTKPLTLFKGETCYPLSPKN